MDASDPRIQNPQLDPGPFELGEGQVGLLLVHGFTATATEMRWLGEYVAQRGFTAKGLLLPGHGTTPEEMLHVKWGDWVEAVDRGLRELSARCQRVVLCGESMGALLSLRAAAMGADVAGVAALAPAIRASNRLLALAPLVQRFVKFFPKTPLDYNNLSLTDQRWQGYHVYPVPAAAQLQKLQRAVRRLAPRMTRPLLMMLGRLDGTIDYQAAQDYFRRVGSGDKELVWMERSTHCVAIDVEWEEVGERVVQFARRVTSSA